MLIKNFLNSIFQTCGAGWPPTSCSDPCGAEGGPKQVCRFGPLMASRCKKQQTPQENRHLAQWGMFRMRCWRAPLHAAATSAKKLPMPKGKGSDVVSIRCKNEKSRVLHAHMGLEGLMPGICQPMRGEVSSLETTGQSCSPSRQQIWDMQDGLVCKHGITAVGFSQGIHADAQLCSSIYDITVPQDNVIVHCPPYCIRDCFVLTARKRARLVHITTKTGFERAPLENFLDYSGVAT